MMQKWQDITPHLYQNIKPISGRLSIRIDRDYIYQKKLANIWVEFDMNEFDYLDPFYGEQKSTDPFKMNLNIWDILGDITITSIRDLENLVLKDTSNELIGSFSNSLLFSVPYLKFGKIENEQISFEMEYVLTNSYSYAFMEGTFEEHASQLGKLTVVLDIKHLLLLIRKEQFHQTVTDYLNKKDYKIEEIHEVTDNGISYRDYNQYYIPYRY
ncbi:MAG: hypothetical protein GY827_05555 [Cytophagales bacterium]|nr:hypothetical protein [Cytophagales bacterium]